MAESAELAGLNLSIVFADLQIKMHMVFGKMATEMSRELYWVYCAFVFMLSLNGLLASKFYDFTAFDIETYKSMPMKNYKGKVRSFLLKCLTFCQSQFPHSAVQLSFHANKIF